MVWNPRQGLAGGMQDPQQQMPQGGMQPQVDPQMMDYLQQIYSMQQQPQFDRGQFGQNLEQQSMAPMMGDFTAQEMAPVGGQSPLGTGGLPQQLPQTFGTGYSDGSMDAMTGSSQDQLPSFPSSFSGYGLGSTAPQQMNQEHRGLRSSMLQDLLGLL